MGIFKRMADIVTANISELVEKCEDPEKMLKQAIREMEESINSATADAAKVLANEKKVEKELARHRDESEKYERRALEAVETGNDDGARSALTKKAEYDKLVKSLEDQLESARESTTVLRQNVETMNAKLDEAKRNLATLVARQKAAEVRKKAMESSSAVSGMTADNAAFDKFERMREKVENAEAEAEALAELKGTGSLAESSLSDDIEDQLAALKKKAGK